MPGYTLILDNRPMGGHWHSGPGFSRALGPSQVAPPRAPRAAGTVPLVVVWFAIGCLAAPADAAAAAVAAAAAAAAAAAIATAAAAAYSAAAADPSSHLQARAHNAARSVVSTQV